MSAFKQILFFLIAISLLSLIYTTEISIVFGFILGVLLVCISYLDFTTYKIPNWVNGLVLISGIAYNFYNNELWLPLISFLIAGSSFYLLSFIYFKIKGRQGLGGGDIKFFACGAVWLFPYYLPLVLLISSVSALCYIFISSFLYPKIEEKYKKAPYGPFLALGIWISFLFGNKILNLFII